MAATYPDLAGLRVVVTGAGGGVGSAVVDRFLAHDAVVFATDKTMESLERPHVQGRSYRPLAADLASAEEVHGLVAKVENDGGPIDILVNAAAKFSGHELSALSVEHFDSVLAVNLRAPVMLAKGFISGMKSKRHGAIVNVASVAVRTGGSRDLLAYASSKGGLVVATKALARWGAPYGVRANAVLPAAIATPMLYQNFDDAQLSQVVSAIPLGRLSQASEVAAAVLFLASDEASYITGVCLDINGGWVMS